VGTCPLAVARARAVYKISKPITVNDQYFFLMIQKSVSKSPMRRHNFSRKRSKRHSTYRRLAIDALEQRIVLHGSISGFVYLDADNDAVRDTGEFGIPGVVVRLATTSSGAPVNESVLTDSNGAYSFTDLDPGTYRLNEQQPEAMVDGSDSTSATGATAGNDVISNLVLAEDQTIAANNFGERAVRPQYINVTWFLASTPAVPQMLRETVALGEDAAGNDELAAAIRAGGTTAPDDEGFGPFAPVVTGPVTDPNLRGTRTDTLAGAPAVTQTHVTTAVDYTGFSNPPSYGPHHAVFKDAQNNSITPRPSGVYSTPQPDEDLVHNLEHGHVWISYNPTLISAADKTKLIQFVTAGGTDNGVILTPRPKNTSAIVLTSWTRQLTLTSFNGTVMRDFIETNRGHAPEGFIPSGQKPANGDTLDDGLPHTAF